MPDCCFLGWAPRSVKSIWFHVDLFVFFAEPRLRLVRGADDPKNAKKYVAKARRAVTLTAAAQAWSAGVPWAEALEIAEAAISKACPKPKAFPKRQAKAKAKARPS